MAAKDTVTKTYLRRNDIFSDLFNFLIYDGQPVISSAKLHELDTSELAVPFAISDVVETVQKYRDILKKLVTMTDGEADYLILGIEEQSEVHYAMPVRNMIYDALQYDKQVREIAKAHKLDEENQGLKSGEYLSGFHQADRLTPVITLVVYFGSQAWDGPLSLLDMLPGVNDKLKPFIQDYKTFVIAPAQLDREDLAKFQTSLQQVFAYIKYSQDKEKLKELLSIDEKYTHLETDAAIVINKITNSRLKINENTEVVDMCLALEEMRQESEAIGAAKGEAIGAAKGEAIGAAKGENKLLQLNKILIADKNYIDLEIATRDPEYRQKLYDKYGIA